MLQQIWHPIAPRGGASLVSGGSCKTGRLLVQVLLQGLLLQLWGPLSSAAGLHRRFRKAAVDLEDTLSILDTAPEVADGTLTLPPSTCLM